LQRVDLAAACEEITGQRLVLLFNVLEFAEAADVKSPL